MDAPLNICVQGVPRSDALDRLIREETGKLERSCEQPIGCRVFITAEKSSRAAESWCEVRIEMRIVPGKTLVVCSKGAGEGDDCDLRRTVQTGFSAAQRCLRRTVKKRPLPAKRPWDREVNGLISAVYPDEGYGFLRRLDGEEIYFHRSAVLDGDFMRLQPGIGVSCISVPGDRGLQASSVQIVDTSATTD